MMVGWKMENEHKNKEEELQKPEIFCVADSFGFQNGTTNPLELKFGGNEELDKRAELSCMNSKWSEEVGDGDMQLS